MPKLDPVRPVPYERRVYHVLSSSNLRLPYIVDTEAYEGNGSCTCEHFCIWSGCAKLLDAGKRRKSEADQSLRCKHIIAAAEYEQRLKADEIEA